MTKQNKDKEKGQGRRDRRGDSAEGRRGASVVNLEENEWTVRQVGEDQLHRSQVAGFRVPYKEWSWFTERVIKTEGAYVWRQRVGMEGGGSDDCDWDQ